MSVDEDFEINSKGHTRTILNEKNTKLNIRNEFPDLLIVYKRNSDEFLNNEFDKRFLSKLVYIFRKYVFSIARK